jgi:uncharacterized membrane protein YqhA
MVELLLKLRWLAVVVSVFSALDAIALAVIGVMRTLEGYSLIFHSSLWGGEPASGVRLAGSIDAFLMSMVFLVISIGFATLFLAQPTGASLERIPEWMRIRNLRDLKFLIWEAILAALVVASMEGFESGTRELSWTSLAPPLAALILAAGLFLARRAG